jgi:hypothetical protein
MKTKRSKYDTNPLDRDVGDRATEAFEGQHGEITEKHLPTNLAEHARVERA